MLVRLPRVSHPQARLLWVATAVLIAWSGVCAISLRVPYLGKIGPDGIADERGFYVALSGQPNPVTGFDYRDSAPYLAGKTARSALLGVHRVLLIPYGAPDNIGGKPIPLKSAVASQIDVAVTRDTIGVFSYAVGLNTFVVDTLGLADPMGSRLLLVPPRLGRIANEKQLPYYWVVAHYTNSAPPYTDDFVVAARAALSCGDLRELLAAIEEPLTAQRFARNLVLSYRLTALRIPANPADAQSRFCSRP